MNSSFLHPTRGPLHLGRKQRSPWTKKAASKFLVLHDFLRTLPVAPEVCDYTGGIQEWGAMGNNELGDCTVAALGHMIQSWTAVSGKQVTVPDSAIITGYEQFCGYNPKYPSTDQGGIIDDVMDGFRDVGIGGYRIDAHAEVNMTQLRMQQALYTFGPLDLGVRLPLTAMKQMDNGEPWTIENFAQSPESQPGTWGGHSLIAVYYSPEWVDLVTWGYIQRASWHWLMLYMDECQAAISKDFTKSPEPLDELVNDLQETGT